MTTSMAALVVPALLFIGVCMPGVSTNAELAFDMPEGRCLDAAEYPGTCKLWSEGYGKAVPAACSGDCEFEKRGPKCFVTGRGCGCTNQCMCTTNGRTNVIGEQCSTSGTAAEL
mmetsp:Transcript_3911/g.8526  ORF Transcript_3911/g.8526 Transcript_3911/m.8526 type:complete len:114 (-) Transcript_3911:240-581(-)